MTHLEEMLAQVQSARNGEGLLKLALDPGKPVEVRSQIVMDAILTGQDPRAVLAFVTRLLGKISITGEAEEAVKLKKAYEAKLAELENGPPRGATFIDMADGDVPGPKPRAYVICPDGTERYPYLHDRVKPEDLRPGQSVYLDGKGVVVVGVAHKLPSVGQTGAYKGRVPETDSFQVTYRDEVLTFRGSQAILDADQAGRLKPGDSVLFCPRRQIIFAKLPAEKANRHRFIDGSLVPDVVAHRDIGDPHWILGWMLHRLRIMLHRPELAAAFDLRLRCAVAMVGPSGTGKTLTIQAWLNAFNVELRRYSGRDDLGSRVIRATTADLLSEYFGVSDRKIDAFFNDVRHLAAEEIELASGRRARLPIIVLLEEAEGLTRRRGEFDGGVYDRIIGMLLQRLDDPIHNLGQLPIFFITTSNRPDMIDVAAWRRLAGVIARFRRLQSAGLTAVLAKKLKPHFHYASDNGTPPDRLRSRLIDQIVGDLFSPNGGQPPQVEITLRDGKKLLRYRRDFLTGAVCEQALSNAIDALVFNIDESGDAGLGLNAAAILDSFNNVIDGLADNLTPHNAADYVDLPDGAAVATVRRLRSPGGRMAHLLC
jgi:hypothetical protein